MYVMLGENVTVNMGLAETIEVEEHVDGAPARICFYMQSGGATAEPYGTLAEAIDDYAALMAACGRGQEVFRLGKGKGAHWG